MKKAMKAMFVLGVILLSFGIMGCNGVGSNDPASSPILPGEQGRAEWRPGIIHAHSTFSDGSRSPEALVERAEGAGVSFLIVTDHYDLIDKPSKGTGTDLYTVDYGFDYYRVRFNELNGGDLLVIPGAEITTFWGIDAQSHLLAVGDMGFWKDEDFQKISELQRNKNRETQQELINYLNSKGILNVAAHPDLVTLAQWQNPWEIGNFQFDPANARELRGIEFFNDGSEGYPRTLQFYLLQLRSGDDVFVTSGCDSHGWVDLFDDARWRKKTWVWSESLDKESLIQAMREGHTYAVADGAYFEDLNYLPGFEFQEVDRPKFEFTVAFDPAAIFGAELYPGSVMTDISVQIYRDGTLASDSVQTYQRDIQNREKIDYSWTDNEVEAGEHSYVIEVEDYLITSPIRLKISAGAEIPEPVFISDDFNQDNGIWNYVTEVANVDSDQIYQWQPYRDEAEQYLVLTEAASPQAGVIWLNQDIFSPFTAEFKYKAGGGSGADGLVLMFYKKKDYLPYDGGGLGFTTLPGGSTNPIPVPGYGIEFDSYNNGFEDHGQFIDPSENHIGLIKDNVNNHLAYKDDPRTEDDLWHNVKIIVGDSSVEVYLDSELVISWQGKIDRTYGGLGFSAATAGQNNWHIIDDVKIWIGEMSPSS